VEKKKKIFQWPLLITRIYCRGGPRWSFCYRWFPSLFLFFPQNIEQYCTSLRIKLRIIKRGDFQKNIVQMIFDYMF